MISPTPRIGLAAEGFHRRLDLIACLVFSLPGPDCLAALVIFVRSVNGFCLSSMKDPFCIMFLCCSFSSWDVLDLSDFDLSGSSFRFVRARFLLLPVGLVFISCLLFGPARKDAFFRPNIRFPHWSFSSVPIGTQRTQGRRLLLSSPKWSPASSRLSSWSATSGIWSGFDFHRAQESPSGDLPLVFSALVCSSPARSLAPGSPFPRAGAPAEPTVPARFHPSSVRQVGPPPIWSAIHTPVLPFAKRAVEFGLLPLRSALDSSSRWFFPHQRRSAVFAVCF
jgi:hypothetical protein